MTGQGKITDPWDLQTALSATALVTPGHVLHLSDGDYVGDFVNNLLGISNSPVIVKSAGGAKLDGSVTFSGKYVVFQDIEFCWTGWTGRQSNQSGSTPSDLTLKTITGSSTGASGVHLKFINCIIHDLSSPFFDDYMIGLEFYGCVIYNIGWHGADRGHGHGLYLHNIVPSMTIENCIVFNNFGWGIHAYSPVGSNLKNFIIKGNTCFNAGKLYPANYSNFLLGADSGQADTASFISNMSYGTGGLQFYGDGAVNITLTNNYMSDGKIGTYTAISESGNYWGAALGNQIFVRPNDYQLGRANVTIYNEAEAATVSVDLYAVTGLAIGDSVTVRNVQNYFVDIQTLVLDADKKITVNMQAINRTVATPIQWTAPATTFPQFGCFVVEKA